MSVTKNKRGFSKLAAETKAFKVYKYTLNLIGNENYFPKRTRWLTASKIHDGLFECIRHIRLANSIKVTDTTSCIQRRIHQYAAIGELNTASFVMQAHYEITPFKKKKYQVWADMYSELLTLIYNWKKKDDDRYRHYRSSTEVESFVSALAEQELNVFKPKMNTDEIDVQSRQELLEELREVINEKDDEKE